MISPTKANSSFRFLSPVSTLLYLAFSIHLSATLSLFLRKELFSFVSLPRFLSPSFLALYLLLFFPARVALHSCSWANLLKVETPASVAVLSPSPLWGKQHPARWMVLTVNALTMCLHHENQSWWSPLGNQIRWTFILWHGCCFKIAKSRDPNQTPNGSFILQLLNKLEIESARERGIEMWESRVEK